MFILEFYQRDLMSVRQGFRNIFLISILGVFYFDGFWIILRIIYLVYLFYFVGEENCLRLYREFVMGVEFLVGKFFKFELVFLLGQYKILEERKFQVL